MEHIALFICFVIVYFSVIKPYVIKQYNKNIKIFYRQSDLLAAINSFSYTKNYKNKTKNKTTQSKVHDKKTNVKVIIMDNNAYWIKDNLFYTAEISVSGEVDKTTTRVVDTMAMDTVQLDKMMFIIDKLREEDFNDRGSSGY